MAQELLNFNMNHSKTREIKQYMFVQSMDCMKAVNALSTFVSTVCSGEVLVSEEINIESLGKEEYHACGKRIWHLPFLLVFT